MEKAVKMDHSEAKVVSLLSDIRLVDPQRYELVQEIRELVHSIAPGATEQVMYGGVMFSRESPFCGIFSYRHHVSVEFGRGCDLSDTWRVLEGGGKFRRHIKVRTPADLSAKHVADYIRQAAAIAAAA